MAGLPNKLAKRGTKHVDSNTVLVSMNCPCGKDDCPFDDDEYDAESWVCGECGNTMRPHPVEYTHPDDSMGDANARTVVAHNAGCDYCCATTDFPDHGRVA